MAFMLPLSVVEMEVETQPKREIHRIKDCKCVYPFSSIPFHPVKNSIALFLSEVLFRSLKETDCNDALFSFLLESVVRLDSLENGLGNFHLIFLLKYSAFLGFYPNLDNEKNGVFFDMLNGCFLSRKPLHTHFFDLTESETLKELIQADFDTMHSLAYSHRRRNALLEQLLQYFSLHVTDFGQLKSIQVLQTLFV
jgi:DNA repair protein RecO (recombination protein O)